MRFLKVFFLLALLAGAFAGAAYALDFNDDAEEAPPGEVGRVYNFPMPSHGGCTDAPYRYVVESGELPPGLTLGNLNDKAGLVSGIPTEAGVWRAWIALKDHCGNSAELLFTFDISHRSYAIKTTSLPSATAGAAYSFTFEAGDHPTTGVSWTVKSGNLPPGLTLSPTGTLSGTPTQTGSYTFTVNVAAVGDDSHVRTDSKQFTLDVGTAMTASLARRVAEVGIPYRSPLLVNGGTAPYTLAAADTLPAGFTVSGNAVTGVPTQAGTFTLNVRLTDARGVTTSVAVSVTVRPRLAIVTKRLAAARAGGRYRVAVATTGGVKPVKWTLLRGRLPGGIRLNTKTGALTGTARSAGTARITLRARDALGATSTRTFVLTVRR